MIVNDKLGCKMLRCDSCGYVSRHWNGKINLFVADFDGTDDCPKCGGTMRAALYDGGQKTREMFRHVSEWAIVNGYD